MKCEKPMSECETRTIRIVPQTNGRTYQELDRDGRPTGRTVRVDENGRGTARIPEGGTCVAGAEDTRRFEWEVRFRGCSTENGQTVCNGSLGDLRSPPARNCFDDRQPQACRRP
jgi:hypothetical protein